MVSWTVKVNLFILGLPWISQACQQSDRGRVCGLNSFFCYDELTESWECQCEVGFHNQNPNKGNRFSCTDINECRIHQHECGNNTWCNNIVGSYQCLCIEGFNQLQVNNAGLHQCSDLDECSQNPRCPENSRCVNLPGSYNCTCFSGFSLSDGFCYEIDECILHGQELCGIYGVCINLIGSLNCRCADGTLNTTCTDSPASSTDASSLNPIPILTHGRAVDTNQIAGESELREMEPQNTSVFVGVGVGLGIFLIAIVFVIGYVLYVKKRRRQPQSDSVQMDLSPLRLSIASIATSTMDASGQGASSHEKDTTENQYHTIHPEPNTPPAGSRNLESMYSNHKIEKTPIVLVSPEQNLTPTEERTEDMDEDDPIVYQIFSGSGGPSSNQEGGVRICNANPKALKSPFPCTCSSEQLHYATIFNKSKQSTKYIPSGEVPPETISEPSAGHSEGLVSADHSSTATYDRLEKRSIRSKAKLAKAGYANVYGESNPSEAGTVGSTSNKRESSPYELVQMVNNK